MRYLLNYNDIKNLKISDIKKKIDTIEGLPLSECKISNLVFYNNKPILTGNGVYIFKNIQGYKYVGKCSSRSFTERIPAHFDIRNTGWFNNFLKRLVNIKLFNLYREKIKNWEKETFIGKNNSTELIIEQASNILDIKPNTENLNYHLILINFETNNNTKKAVNDLEYILRNQLNPLNKFKADRIINKEICINEFTR